MDEIPHLIAKQDWNSIVANYTPNLLARTLSFKEGRVLACKMLFNEARDDNLREYSAELLNEIRLVYPDIWQEDWRNDVFLGDANYITMKFDERYEAYMRAFKKISYKPPSLLISIAACYLSPHPKISLEEAEKLVKEALKEETSVEAVVLLRGIYAEKKDATAFEYWDKVLKEVEAKNVHTKRTWPDIEF